MSGILGSIQTVGAGLESGRFQAMLDELHLRGPDAEGIWQDQRVQLGHRMLRTTPEAHVEKLPHHDVENGCVVTSDARLDNRQELIETLGRSCFKMDVIPDSVIILQAYLKWGSGCVHHLLGDFSFAIWDIKEQKLFCARDFLGVKPFYYCSMGGLFLFCSESRAIAKHSGLLFNINEPRIADSFTPHLEGYDTTSTFYKEISRLSPAHTLELKDGDIRIGRYWNPEPVQGNLCKTDNEYREALTEILEKAVADRCRGDENPAILLSGGVDSAAILGFTQNYCRVISGGRVQTYSGISENIVDCKESNLISLLSRENRVDSHLYSPKDLSKYIEPVFQLASQLGEPFDICMALHFLLYQQASSQGQRFILDGVDGDVSTGLSYSYPVQLFRQGLMKTAWSETFLQSRDFFDGFISPYRLLGRYARSAFTPQIIKYCRWKYSLPGSVKKTLENSVISDSFAHSTNLAERLIQFSTTHRKHKARFPSENYLGRVRHPFLAIGLERYDRVASLCSIEPRHPLLDKRLIEFYMGLPWNQFMRNGWSKFLFRRVAEQYLPNEVCWRTGKEHVGYKFIKELLNLKKDSLYALGNKHKDRLEHMVKTEFTLAEGIQANFSKDSGIHSDVAGIVLWLNCIQDVK